MKHNLLLCAILSAAATYANTTALLRIDADLPAGNIIVNGIENDTVKLQQDLRDSKQWFYWAFRVRGANGRTLQFDLPTKKATAP